MAGPLRSPQIFFRCAPENFAMRRPVGAHAKKTAKTSKKINNLNLNN
jgi:hypothetical protein